MSEASLNSAQIKQVKELSPRRNPASVGEGDGSWCGFGNRQWRLVLAAAVTIGPGMQQHRLTPLVT